MSNIRDDARNAASAEPLTGSFIFVPLLDPRINSLAALTAMPSWPLVQSVPAATPVMMRGFAPQHARTDSTTGEKSDTLQPDREGSSVSFKSSDADTSCKASEDVGPIKERIVDAERMIDEAEGKISEIERKFVESLRKTKRPHDKFKKQKISTVEMLHKSSDGCESRARRGDNVRSNPAMQKTARDGQRWWQAKVQELRIDFDQDRTAMVHNNFTEQRYMCSVRNFKSQKESLLIFLQLSMQRGLITPLSFCHPGDEANGFLGWTGFLILPGCGARFKDGVEGWYLQTGAKGGRVRCPLCGTLRWARHDPQVGHDPEFHRGPGVHNRARIRNVFLLTWEDT